MYVPKYFSLQEVLPSTVFHRYRDAPTCLWLIFDEDLLISADLIRKHYGPIVINNWHWGGIIQYAGFRYFDHPDGAEISQHKFGRAFDLHPMRVHPHELINDYHTKDLECFRLIRYVEPIVDTPTWMHIDTRAR